MGTIPLFLFSRNRSNSHVNVNNKINYQHATKLFFQMSTVAQEPPRRASFSPQDRKASLREMPSYREEASKALNRREDLKSLSQR